MLNFVKRYDPGPRNVAIGLASGNLGNFYITAQAGSQTELQRKLGKI